MNQRSRSKRYLRIPRLDGVSVRVPVSDFVLNLTKQPARLGIRITGTSMAQQAAAFVMVAVLCSASFGMTYANPINTISYFRDEEVSRSNLFAAGFLGFRLNPGEVTIPIEEGGSTTISPLFTPLPNTFDITYRVRAEVVGDETPLCGYIMATGTTSPYLYSGPLTYLVTNPATTTGHGNLEITLPQAPYVPDGDRCTIALVYRGWFTDAPENTGYTDEKRDTFTFVYSAPQQPVTTNVAQSESEGTPPPPEDQNTDTPSAAEIPFVTDTMDTTPTQEPSSSDSATSSTSE